ncbi:MAG: toll/interleukin-1 receptor domain-containing protein [Candidatus Aminicenantes bacterium]|jgi:hypothetical protein
MIYASTFLSHSSVDSEIVHLVARELGRRGILPWLDKNELEPGTDMAAQLDQAIKNQTTVTLFLSKAALASKWVGDELKAALTLEEETGAGQRIIPVFMDDPGRLVESHPLLKQRWLHPDGDGRVTRKGIITDVNQDPQTAAKEIAVKLSQSIYQLLETGKKDDLIIYLDQRGSGRRHGKPPGLPKNILSLNSTVLVFRPDQEKRDPGETLHGQAWQETRDIMSGALATALGTLRGQSPRKIRLLGNSQLVFPFLTGWHCNRNTNVTLYCYNMDGSIFSNENQERFTPLQGGNPRCETKHKSISPISKGIELEAISLLLAPEIYVPPVLSFIKEMPIETPLKWVKSGRFKNSEEAMQYIANVVALLDKLRSEHRIRKIYLYLGLPFHMIPLLAANLLHVIETIVFMEYRRDLQGMNEPINQIYAPLLP